MDGGLGAPAGDIKLLCHMTSAVNAYRCFARLAESQLRGKDYDILLCRRGSDVAVIAPHGGLIEPGTSEIARAIAGEDFNFYAFEGIRRSGNYPYLHLSSHLFDEPQCLALVAQCRLVVAVHGCRGADERVYLGGLDVTLKSQIAGALAQAEVAIETSGHRFRAINPTNICNRGYSSRGVQLELTGPLRRSARATHVVAAVRSVLLDADAAD